MTASRGVPLAEATDRPAPLGCCRHTGDVDILQLLHTSHVDCHIPGTVQPGPLDMVQLHGPVTLLHLGQQLLRLAVSSESWDSGVDESTSLQLLVPRQHNFKSVRWYALYSPKPHLRALPGVKRASVRCPQGVCYTVCNIPVTLVADVDRTNCTNWGRRHRTVRLSTLRAGPIIYWAGRMKDG